MDNTKYFKQKQTEIIKILDIIKKQNPQLYHQINITNEYKEALYNLKITESTIQSLISKNPNLKYIADCRDKLEDAVLNYYLCSILEFVTTAMFSLNYNVAHIGENKTDGNNHKLSSYADLAIQNKFNLKQKCWLEVQSQLKLNNTIYIKEDKVKKLLRHNSYNTYLIVFTLSKTNKAQYILLNLNKIIKNLQPIKNGKKFGGKSYYSIKITEDSKKEVDFIRVA